MGNVVTTAINLAPLERRLDKVAEATNRIERELTQTNNRLGQVTEELSELSHELNALKDSFNRFMDDSKKATTLQKAATELIRVRQELEQNFGGYKIVRETMLGVLQATDLALVKKTTISQVTEELMLSTPDYWLAPCLVAVAAWIGNDRDLANRAIKEAVKRDEEKTALAMALICRRNNRTDTCFEWLSIYFAHQSAEHFTESNFTYLNAYLNGVFGPDEKHMCEDYVAKWLREIQSNGADFEQRQTEIWREYCKNFTVDLEGQFPEMSGNVREYAEIAAYVSRINSVGRISDKFSSMKNITVEEEKLKKDIDQTLVSLISRCDEKEEPLRKEERYLQAIRYFDGDTDAAKRSVLEADRKRTEETIDLVSQMTNIIINREDARPSERKTSVNFLSSYIRSGFQEYMAEKKPEFPEQITLNVDTWSGTTSDGTNADELQRGYELHMQQERQEKLATVKMDKPKQRKILAGVIGGISLIFLFLFAPLGIMGLIGAGVCFFTSGSVEKANQQQIANINAEYDAKIAAGKKKIDDILTEWKKAKTIVDSYENGAIPDVVA